MRVLELIFGREGVEHPPVPNRVKITQKYSYGISGSLTELVRQFREKKLFGAVLNCQVKLGKYLLADDSLGVDIKSDKINLFLKYLEESCPCPKHKTLHVNSMIKAECSKGLFWPK